MMYINHNSFNLNDLLVQGAAASSTIYNPAQLLQPPGTATGTTAHLTSSPASYQQQLQSYNQQLHQHNKALYTYPAQVNPYDPNRTVQTNGAQSVAQQNRNGRSTSASSLSSVSSTSSTSSIYSNATQVSSDQQQQQHQAQTLLTNSSQQQPSQTQYNPKLGTNNLYNPYNFAYYNPYTTQQTSAGSSTNTISTPTVTSAVGVSMPKLQTSLPNQGSTTASQTKQETSNVLTTVDPNYQLNVLPTVASKTNNTGTLTNPMHFSTSPTSAADTSSLLLYTNSNKNLQAPSSASIYNTSTHYHKPTTQATSQLTFLPTGHTGDLFTSNTGLHSTHLAGLHSPAYAAQPLQLHSFASSKTQFSIGVKRKRRFKKPPELRNVLPKNSLMLLHEYRPNVEYRFVCQSGPIHRPMFTMCVDINEHKFEGTGKTKKDARMQAAEKALEFLIQHPEYIQKAVPADKSANTNSTASEECKKSPENEEEEEQGDETNAVLNEEEEVAEEAEEPSGKRLKKEESNEDSNVESHSNTASPDVKEENVD